MYYCPPNNLRARGGAGLLAGHAGSRAGIANHRAMPNVVKNADAAAPEALLASDFWLPRLPSAADQGEALPSQFRIPTLSARPASGWTASLPHTATPVSVKAFKKLNTRW